MIARSPRRLLATSLIAVALVLSLGLLSIVSTAGAEPLDLENLSGAQAEKMLEEGQITSVELVKDYLARIAALNKAGAGLNAVTQINPDVIEGSQRRRPATRQTRDPRPRDGPADPAQGHHRRDADVHLRRRLGAA